MDKKDYYDIEVNAEKTLSLSQSSVDDFFYVKDLKQRKLFINDEIDSYSVFDIVKHILQYNAEDKDIDIESRQPILLYVTSCGGSVDDGFELIDVIKSSKTPVYTINLGYQYSMGFLIGLAGDKRFAMKNAKFLMHDGSNFIYNSGAKAQDQMEFQKKVEERIKEYIISNSNLSLDEYNEKLRVEWYLFADEAKSKGFVDYIIGQDCDIDIII